MTKDIREFPVLFVDDETDLLRACELTYGDEFSVVSASGGEEALDLMRVTDVAVIVADQRMPRMTGAELLEKSMEIRPDATRIILTGYVDNEALVHAINRSRIFRYFHKPWKEEELRLALHRGIDHFHLTRENARLVEELRRANERLAVENAYLRDAAAPRREIIGTSAEIQRALQLVRKVAPASSTALIEGETGTGKELIARAIHDLSPRRDRIFVAVNCAAISDSLLESELFGHRRGSFTGAVSDHKGYFEVADGGTLFLDEVTETSPAAQAKLLRVLQEGEVQPVGDSRPRRVDVRVVASTNRNLDEAVAVGRFRQDLLYRLRVFPIAMAPLRQRREDIPLLATHLLRRTCIRLKKATGELTPEAMQALCCYDFPGNVRELENEIERAVLLAEPGEDLTVELLSDRVKEAGEGGGHSSDGLLQSKRDEFERAQIAMALEQAMGSKTRAAELLGITVRGLNKKIQRLGIRVP